MSKRIKTPTLDKYNLHSFGGYCTCFSSPYTRCTACAATAAAKARWAALTPAIRKKALAESEALRRADPIVDNR